MKCDIVVPVYDQLEYTKPCLESILRCTRVDYRLTVVDNGSAGDTQDYLRDYAPRHDIKVIRLEPNQGWVTAANTGMSGAAAPYVCLMNNDTLVSEGWLQELISIAESAPDIGIVNPVWEKPERMSVDSFGRKLQGRRGESVETDWARGCCMLIRREVLDRLRGLDPVYSPGYFDDHDFSIRALRAGFRCFRACGSFVWHYRNATFFEKMSRPRWNELFERNRVIFYRKWGIPLRMLFVFDAPEPPARWKELTELFLALARDQNRIYVYHSADMSLPVHDNIFPRRIPPAFLSMVVPGVLWDNRRRSKGKHFHQVYVAGDRMLRLLQRLRLDTVFPCRRLPSALSSVTGTVRELKFAEYGVDSPAPSIAA